MMILLQKRSFLKFLFIIQISLLILLSSCTANKTDKSIDHKSLFFNEGDKVCFVGNSITHSGGFHHNILLYHITRFPDSQVSFFNCGIAGDSSIGVLNRMEDDILIHDPTHAVIMLGMNDVQRDLYSALPSVDKDTLNLRNEAIKTYKGNLEKIINTFIDKNIKVILQTPSIYDQTADLSEPNHLGVNDALAECAVFLDSIAAKYQLPVVDYFSFMNKVNSTIQKSDPSKTLTGNDRIHPGATGHLVMAFKFLKTEGAPKYVSKIIIDKNGDSKSSFNCNIDSVIQQNNSLAFRVMEKALPFPTTEEQEVGLKIVPFVNELNVQLLKVMSLSKGQYQLFIDDKLINVFNEKQLNIGVNLSNYHTTPQYKQSKKVLSLFYKLWEIEWSLRDLKLIEYIDDYKACPNKGDLVFVESFLDSVFTKKFAGLSYASYYNDQLKKYISNKPKEEEFKIKSEKLRKKIYKAAQPKTHIFILRNKE